MRSAGVFVYHGYYLFKIQHTDLSAVFEIIAMFGTSSRSLAILSLQGCKTCNCRHKLRVKFISYYVWSVLLMFFGL